MKEETVDRAAGLCVRLKLSLSYASFLMLAGALLLAAGTPAINRLRTELTQPPVIVTVLHGGYRI
jgi:hypothetical protein